MADDPPILHKWPDDEFFRYDDKPLWVDHPDRAGGMWPIDPAERGDIDVPCPHCGKPLVREGSAALIQRSIFLHNRCGHLCAGSDVHPAPKPRPSGA